jgi:hypothetical protein
VFTTKSLCRSPIPKLPLLRPPPFKDDGFLLILKRWREADIALEKSRLDLSELLVDEDEEVDDFFAREFPLARFQPGHHTNERRVLQISIAVSSAIRLTL